MEYSVDQISREELRTMKHHEITKARAEGRLDEVLGIPPKATGEAITREDLKGMAPEKIMALRQAGELVHLGVMPREHTN